jgi:hypothetical protein
MKKSTMLKRTFNSDIKPIFHLKWLVFLLIFHVGFAQNNQKQFLNGTWAFKIDPYSQGEKEGWQNENLDSASWDEMNVPGNWDLVNEYSEYAGDAWYSRTFTVDKSAENQQIRLVFQSVYNDSKVWINGNFVGENHFGYLPFHFNISKYIKFGQENRITVLANNVFKKGAFWNWGGIRRPVWLEITPLSRIEFQHIDAIPDLKKGTANLSVKIATSNLSNEAKKATFNIKITRKNKLVVKGKIETIIPANTAEHEAIWTSKLNKSQVELWHHDFPNLYESEISLIENNEIQHQISNRFGIRKVEIDGLQLKLNGESIRPVGFNLVPEDRFTGNTLPFERIKEDVDLMKRLGATFARLSHVSLPKEYLDYLDEKGIMVLEEVGLWGKDAWVDPEHPMPKEWLQRMVELNYNHPSIVGWSLGNEIGKEENNPKVKAYMKNAVALSKQLDPNRLAIYASNTAQSNPDDATQFTDLSTINLYGGWGGGVDRAWKNHQKPVFVTEFGNILNDEDPNLGNIPIEKMMESMRNKDYVLGASVWTFNDYRSTYHGVTGWKTPTSQNRAWGIVTTFRNKKRGFYDLQKEFAPIRSLKITEVDKNAGKAIIVIQPRNKLDIPANILRGFQLKWYLIDEDFNENLVGDTFLKTIYPGDASFLVPIKWNSENTIQGLKVALIDPQGYIVLEEISYFAKPKKPIINYIHTSGNTFRVSFDSSKNVSEHYIKYQQGDSSFVSKKSINNFIEIENERLNPEKSITLQLIAVNNAGESDLSETKTTKFNENELPPIIWDIKRVENSIFIGFSVSPFDYLYEVEYGTEPLKYSNKVTTKVKGVLSIPNINKEKNVYFRMRTIKQWGFASEWTEEYTIKK